MLTLLAAKRRATRLNLRGTKLNLNRMTEEQSTWLTEFAEALAGLVKNFKDGEDVCSIQVVNVLRQIKKFMNRYPNPQEAAAAMSYTGRINYARENCIQRGEGVRRKRIVDCFPIRRTEDGEEVAIDLIDRNAIDPATQAADRDECRREMAKITPVVATGLALTAVFGLNQSEAATQMGIGRTYLSRMIKKSERKMRDGRQDVE